MKRLAETAAKKGLPLETKEGALHTKVTIGDRTSVVPRHNEINEITARSILKQMGADQ